MKTIRQIADERGVSKQAVFKKIKREPLSTSLQGLMVEVDGAVSENAEKTVEVDGVISVLQATIDTLQGQLEVKDRQIEQQAQTITRLTNALGRRPADKGLGRKQTEWKAWMEREKSVLKEIAQEHGFEIISLGGGRQHMDLPQFKEAAKRLEAIQEQVGAAEHEIAELDKQRKALKCSVKALKAMDKVKVDLEAIQPEKTLTGAVRGITVEQIEELKTTAVRCVAAEQKVQELKAENKQLQSQIPSTTKKMKELQEKQRLENQNLQLKVQVEYLETSLEQERIFSAQLLEGVETILDFLDKHLPEPLKNLVEKVRELVPVPEVQTSEKKQEYTIGSMER